MLDQQKDNDAEPAHVPRNKDGSIRKTFVRSVARGIAAADAGALRKLVSDLHEADLGDLIEALEPEQRPRLVELLGIDFDFTALTEVDDAVREEILDELPSKTVARGRARSRIRRRGGDPRRPAPARAGRDSRATAAARAGRARPAACNTRKIPPAGACRPSSWSRRPVGPSGRPSTTCARPPICRTASTSFTSSTPTAVFSARCRSTGCCAASVRCRSPS